ncbi:MAG: cytochrome ubiquinol oxidase subunit I, partial [Verrucomicrobiota bacterium]
KVWEDMTKFWLKIFALTFALGVATGIPLQFSLGTNWARYSRFVGDVFGSVLSAEGFFAFLIEGGFLGLLLFGWKKVSSTVHFLSTILVSFGAHFSAFWIVAANSWMQYPTGYELVTQSDGTVVAQVTNWVQMLFNPTAIDHIIHV